MPLSGLVDTITGARADPDARYVVTTALDAAIDALGYLKDAPTDTKVYARQDGAWVEVQTTAAPTEVKFEGLAPNGSFIMTGVTVGTGALTVGAVNQPVLAQDVDGVYRSFASGSAAWTLGRYDAGSVYSTAVGGATLSPAPKLQVDPAATTLLPYNRSITEGGNWSLVTGVGGVGSRAQDQVGIDGVANTATTLTITTSLVTSAGWQRAVALVNGNTITTQAFIRKVITATHTVGIQHTAVGGTTQVERGWLNPETGVFGVSGANTTAHADLITSSGVAWYRFTVSTTVSSVGASSVNLRLVPGYGTTAGGEPVASQAGSMVVDAVNSYLNAGHNKIRIAAPLFNDTVTTSITRAAPSLTFDIANHANTTSGYGIRVVSKLARADMAAGNHQILSLAGADLLWYDAVAGEFKSTDGVNTASFAYDIVADQEMVVSVVYDSTANSLEVGVNGNYGAATTYDAFPTGTEITLFAGASHSWLAGELRRVGPVT